MPRSPRLATKLVKLKGACEALAISRPTFWRRWHLTFTDPRPESDRAGCERKVYEDELAVAVNEASRGKAAVLLFRKQMGRL